ncbi:transposase [Moorena sp. SIO3I6]|uniref:transposase n=1 Tax=Moorena sp. SIO3I6 TaxID=2607831 RepID=UPI00344EA888
MTLLNYHFVWCPKRRKSVLNGSIKMRLQEIIFELCKDNNWRLIAKRDNARSRPHVLGG